MLYFNLKKLLLLLFSSQIDCFRINNNNIKVVNNNNKQNNIIMNYDICPSYLEKYTQFLNQEQGEFLVKKTAGVFPQMDSVSNFVLHTNDILINKVLNNNDLSSDIKKNLVLFLIHMTQNGDSTGSHILQFYNDLVNCLL
tara:strand:- start:6579 stop:6998 length:420 start_codon:yes stop_codon:yes gene_type:complete